MFNGVQQANKPFTLRSNKGDMGDYVKQIEKNLLQLWDKQQKIGNEITKIQNILINGDIDHATLFNLDSTDYTHLTATEETDLTDGGFTVLHKHYWYDNNLVYVITGTPYTITNDYNEYVYSGAVSGIINLPQATGTGKRFTIKNYVSGTARVDGWSSNTIDEDATKDLAQYESLDIFDFIAGKWAIIN